MLTDFEGERGDVGDAERSLSLNVALSGASPLDLADTGVTGRAGVDGVDDAESGLAGVGGACSTVSLGSGIFPYLRSAALLQTAPGYML